MLACVSLDAETWIVEEYLDAWVTSGASIIPSCMQMMGPHLSKPYQINGAWLMLHEQRWMPRHGL